MDSFVWRSRARVAVYINSIVAAIAIVYFIYTLVSSIWFYTDSNDDELDLTLSRLADNGTINESVWRDVKSIRKAAKLSAPGGYDFAFIFFIVQLGLPISLLRATTIGVDPLKAFEYANACLMFTAFASYLLIWEATKFPRKTHLFGESNNKLGIQGTIVFLIFVNAVLLIVVQRFCKELKSYLGSKIKGESQYIMNRGGEAMNMVQ